MPIVNDRAEEFEMNKVRTRFSIMAVALAAIFFVAGSSVSTQAQMRFPDLGRIGDAVNVQVKVGEITLESIDFRNQTANLSA